MAPLWAPFGFPIREVPCLPKKAQHLDDGGTLQGLARNNRADVRPVVRRPLDNGSTSFRLDSSVNDRRRCLAIRHFSALRSYPGCPLVRRKLSLIRRKFSLRMFDRLYLGIGCLLRPRLSAAALV